MISALLDLPEDNPMVISQIEEITQAIELEMASARNWKDLFKSAHDAQGEKRRMLTVSTSALKEINLEANQCV